MASIKKPGPWNPQKATAYVGKGVLKSGGRVKKAQLGDTLSPIKGAITPVPNGPLIKKSGVFKGSSLKSGGKVMLKRKDGSKSPRGLWDNIRAAKGSGKKPTAQMLKQEKKIKAKTK